MTTLDVYLSRPLWARVLACPVPSYGEIALVRFTWAVGGLGTPACVALIVANGMEYISTPTAWVVGCIFVAVMGVILFACGAIVHAMYPQTWIQTDTNRRAIAEYRALSFGKDLALPALEDLLIGARSSTERRKALEVWNETLQELYKQQRLMLARIDGPAQLKHLRATTKELER